MDTYQVSISIKVLVWYDPETGGPILLNPQVADDDPLEGHRTKASMPAGRSIHAATISVLGGKDDVAAFDFRQIVQQCTWTVLECRARPNAS